MKLSTLIGTIKTLQSEGIQKAINNLSDGYIDPDFFPVVETKHGDKYYRANVNDITNTFDHYPLLTTITKEDIVFDIGAFIGGFTIPAAKRAKKVYAFEPIYYKELKKNVDLNRIENVTVRPIALGNTQGYTSHSYFRDAISYACPFRDIRDGEEPPTYLKCNCEGGEWALRPEDFEGITTIEIQFHYSKNFNDNPDLVQWLRENYITLEETTDTRGVNGIYRVLDLHGVKH